MLYWLAAANLIAFVLMVLDKSSARRGERRMPEGTLLFWAFLGGAPGTFAASRLVRHKTRKQPFATWMMIWLALDMVLLLLWLLGLLEPLVASALARIATLT